MGYRLDRLDEPVFMAGPKSMRTEFGNLAFILDWRVNYFAYSKSTATGRKKSIGTFAILLSSLPFVKKVTLF